MSPLAFRRKTIRSEKTLGQRLAQHRIAARLTIPEAEAKTRVRAKYLVALEEGRFDLLPEEIYTIGFVRRYAQLLGLDSNEAVREYQGERRMSERLGWVESSDGDRDILSAVHPLGNQRVVVTPKLFWVGGSLMIVLGIAGYLWYQVHGFMSAPNLNLAQSNPEMIVSTASIKIEGQTDDQASVTINSEPVATDPEGQFTQEVHLNPGLNTIEVAAKNRLNKETRRLVRVLATYPPTGN